MGLKFFYQNQGRLVVFDRIFDARRTKPLLSMQNGSKETKTKVSSKYRYRWSDFFKLTVFFADEIVLGELTINHAKGCLKI